MIHPCLATTLMHDIDRVTMVNKSEFFFSRLRKSQGILHQVRKNTHKVFLLTKVISFLQIFTKPEGIDFCGVITGFLAKGFIAGGQ